MFREREGYDSPEYKAWRNSVMVRDQWSCIMCKSKNKLQAHHIIRFADVPSLRYRTHNGVTLCEYCHEKVTGKEKQFEQHFQSYVKSLKKVHPVKRPFGGRWKPKNPFLRY